MHGLLVWDDATKGGETRVIPESAKDRPRGPVAFSSHGNRVLCLGHPCPIVYDTKGIGRIPIPIVGYGYLVHTVFATDDAVILCNLRMAQAGAAGYQTQIDYRLLSDPRHEAAKWSIMIPGTLSSGALLVTSRGEIITFENRLRDDRRASDLHLVTRELTTGRELRSALQSAIAVGNPVVSQDGYLIAAWHAKTVTVWRRDSWSKPTATLKNDGMKHFTGIAFHPSGRYLGATSNDQTVKLYDTTTWKVAKTFTWKIGRMRSIAFSPDGTLAASGSDSGKVVVWDVDT
jgi:WD40 repeat protein